MKNIISLILVGIILLNGCTWTQLIPPDETYLKDLNNKLKAETVIIELESGNIIVGNDIQLSSDSTSWAGVDSEKYYNVQTAKIKEIRVSNRSRSGTIGLLLGISGGAVIGFIESKSERYNWVDVVEKGFRTVLFLEGESKIGRYAAGMIIGGLAGGLLGLTIGTIVGSTEKYVFTEVKL